MMLVVKDTDRNTDNNQVNFLTKMPRKIIKQILHSYRHN